MDQDISENHVKSVNRVFDVIEALVKYPNGCSLAILTQETKLNKSTVYRFLKTLKNLGYVANDSLGNNYRLTFKIVNIGEKLIHETNIVQLALSRLTDLRNLTKETINLKLFQHDHSILLFKLEPVEGNFRTRTYMGQTIPLYCSASGKILLAHKDEDFVRAYWKANKKNIKKITQSTVIDIEEFLKIIKKAKKQGYSFDNEENEIGITCIAVPVFDIHGDVNYAISLAVQTVKFIKDKNKYLAPLVEVGKGLSQDLGYDNLK